MTRTRTGPDMNVDPDRDDDPGRDDEPGAQPGGAKRTGRRPRVPGHASCVRLSVRLTPDERRDLESVARDNQTSLTDVLREAVNEYVADYRDRAVFQPDPDRVSSSAIDHRSENHSRRE